MSEHMVFGDRAKVQGPTHTGTALQRTCSKCPRREKEKNRGALQRSGGKAGPEDVPPVVREALREPGRPLDPETLSFMESRFGHDFAMVPSRMPAASPSGDLTLGDPHDAAEHEADRAAHDLMNGPALSPGRTQQDFSGVRVHTGTLAARSSEAIRANAFTVGRDIVFGAGRFAPGSNEGKRLIAHELAHVVQQSGGSIRRSRETAKAVNPGEDEEALTRSKENGSASLFHGAGVIQRDLAIEPPRPRAVARVLTDAQVQQAITFNRRVVSVIGPTGIGMIRDVLGTSAEPAVVDEDFVQAVVRWQAMQGLTGTRQDGKLGPATARPLFREIGAENVGRAQLASGPAYHATTALNPPPVVGGREQAGFRLEADFEDDPENGIYASCGEIRQYFWWDAAFAAAAPGGPPRTGVPAGAAAETWTEDRDQADTRYGHRTGQFSAPMVGDQYIDNTNVRNQGFGHQYRGRDFPGHGRFAGVWRFNLRAIDICHGNARLGDDYLRIRW